MRVNLTKKEIINSVFMQIGFSKKISEKIKYKDSYIKNLTKECFTKGYLKSSKKGLAGGTLTKKSLKILTSL